MSRADNRKKKKKKKGTPLILVAVLILIVSLAAFGLIQDGKADPEGANDPAVSENTGTQDNTGDDTQDEPENSDDSEDTRNEEEPSDDENSSTEPVSSGEGNTEGTGEGEENPPLDPGLIVGSPAGPDLDDYEDAPSKGDDTSITGMPRLIDMRENDNGNLLVLVNKYHAVSKTYSPKDLITIDNKYGSYTDMEMKAEAYEAYKKLYADAKALGYDFKLCSTMRSWETQKGLFNNSLNNRGRETTNIRSAYPGRSEHHTGLAIDVTSASMGWGLTQDFADYEDGKWINEHCHEYGFILRYPNGKTDITGYAYEPWHFRYVGVKAATEIMARGITLEEYLGEA